MHIQKENMFRAENNRNLVVFSEQPYIFVLFFMCLQYYNLCSYICWGVQWLSGRVLDSRPRGRGFEPHRRHCVVVLEQDTFILA